MRVMDFQRKFLLGAEEFQEEKRRLAIVVSVLREGEVESEVRPGLDADHSTCPMTSSEGLGHLFPFAFICVVCFIQSSFDFILLCIKTFDMFAFFSFLIWLRYVSLQVVMHFSFT